MSLGPCIPTLWRDEVCPGVMKTPGEIGIKEEIL